MAHSNYAKDRDLMMEAYGSVEGIIPHTQSTAPARMFNEGHCSDEEHEGTEDTVKVSLELELDKETAENLHGQLMDEVVPAEDSSCASNEDEETTESVELGGKLYEVGNDDPNDDGLVIKIEKHPNGYFITGGVYSEPEDFVNDPDSATEGYGYALTLEGQPMDEDDLEDGLGHAEDAEHVPAEDSSCASDEEAKFTLQGVGGMHGQSTAGDSQSFNSLEEVCAAAGIDPSECAKAELWDDLSDGTKEFQVDEDNVIVMHAHSTDGEQDEEEVVAESYTSAYLERM